MLNNFPRRLSALAVGLALSGLASANVHAEKSPALDRISLWVGGYYSNNDTDLSVRGRGDYAGVGGKVNFEDDLGLDKHSTNPRVRADFLLGDSQGFSFDFYQINRDNTRSVNQYVPLVDADVGAKVKGKVKYNFGSGAYKWWFGHESDVFGVGLGAAYYKVDLRLRADAYAGGESVSGSEGYSDHEWAPMLTLGWRHAFNDQWRMYFDASGVKKNGGDLDGHIWNASLGVEWFPWTNVGFALEYAASHVNLNKDYDNTKARLAIHSDGPAFYLRARF
ncbi:MAG: hypothetical protein QJR11_01580 [Fulvimonas sp.]|nr:hypothetical protein [Fulvimonas sp.]